MVIYYDSKTGNVARFVSKIKAATNWECIKICNNTEARQEGHLITYTTQIGAMSENTSDFVKKYTDMIVSVSSSGNRNWGVHFAVAADLIAKEYNIPVLLKFELSGFDSEVNKFIQKVRQHADKEVDIAQQ